MEQTKVEFSVLLFETAKEWLQWLDSHHASANGVWLRFAKKASPLTSVSYAQALEAALCYGWIDGQSKTYDADSWIQKFTPRRARSLWSKVNREKALALIESGQMQTAGLAEIERARAGGRWDAAYHSQSQAEVPVELAEALEKNPVARDFFAALNKTNRYAIIFRIQTAKKPETRAKRIEQLVAMLERGEKIYP